MTTPIRTTATLPPADGCEQRDGRAVPQLGCEAAGVADAHVADEDVHVAADRALLVEHPRGHAGMALRQDPQGVAHRAARHLQADVARAARERAEKSRQLEGDRHTRAARTQTTGGSPVASAVHESPASRDANSLPLRVPK